MSSEIRFEVLSKLEKRIRTSESYWTYLTSVKRPSIRNLEQNVKDSITRPMEIRKSKRDPFVFLYYGESETEAQPFICTVVKHLNGEGYIITAYLTRRMVGVVAWKPS